MKFTTEEYTEEEKKANGNMMKGGKLHDKICDYIQESYKLSDSQINDVSMGVWMAIQAKDEQIEILKFERVPVEIYNTSFTPTEISKALEELLGTGYFVPLREIMLKNRAKND